MGRPRGEGIRRQGRPREDTDLVLLQQLVRAIRAHLGRAVCTNRAVPDRPAAAMRPLPGPMSAMRSILRAVSGADPGADLDRAVAAVYDPRRGVGCPDRRRVRRWRGAAGGSWA